MIMLYGAFRNTTLLQLKIILDKLLPESNSKFIETQTVLISEGDVLTYSIDRSEEAKEFIFSAQFNGDEQELQLFLPKMVKAMKDNMINYSMEYEIENDGNYFTFEIETFQHNL